MWVMWISIHLYFYASTSIIPPPIKMEKFATRRYAIFSPYKLPKVNYSLLLPTHYTEHHPVISHRDVPPQECCTSGTPSAMPKDCFPASTFDSHLQSASFGEQPTQLPIYLSYTINVNFQKYDTLCTHNKSVTSPLITWSWRQNVSLGIECRFRLVAIVINVKKTSVEV